MPYQKTIIGDAILYLGDCLEVMADLDHVDAVVTDPPYDARTHAGAHTEITFDPVDVGLVLPPMLRLSRGWVLAFCALEMCGEYKNIAKDKWIRAGFWRRTNGVPQFSGDRPSQPGEGIAIMHCGEKKAWNGHGKHAYWESPTVANGPHPTTKPQALMEMLIMDFTQSAETILDPFMGSGTPGVACANLGREFIGIEIEPKYFDIACKRIDLAQAQGKLFVDDATPVEQVKLF